MAELNVSYTVSSAPSRLSARRFLAERTGHQVSGAQEQVSVATETINTLRITLRQRCIPGISFLRVNTSCYNLFQRRSCHVQRSWTCSYLFLPRCECNQLERFFSGSFADLPR